MAFDKTNALPFFENDLYAIYAEEVKQPIYVGGMPFMEYYAVVNKNTDMAEYKTTAFPNAVAVAQMAQQEVDRLEVGWENGPTVHSGPVPGDNNVVYAPFGGIIRDDGEGPSDDRNE